MSGYNADLGAFDLLDVCARDGIRTRTYVRTGRFKFEKWRFIGPAQSIRNAVSRGYVPIRPSSAL